MISPYIEASQLRELTAKREIRPREVAEMLLERIKRIDPKLNAFVTVTAERALADAERLEKAGPDQIKSMPLYGVGYTIKDTTLTKGIKTTFGSKNYENFVPEVDAEITVRMRNAGGILLGKTATPEFAGRPTVEGGLCPPARNPWNPNHTAGGSTGGGAAAVASGMCAVADATDGGGSIRIPASCCGAVGLKPSRGRITLAPAYGEFWGGMLTSGPIARSVRDAALFLDVLAGPVVGDPYWAPIPSEPFSAAVSRRPAKLRLASLCESALSRIDPEVRAAFDSALQVLGDMGHTIEPIKIDPAARLVDAFGVVVTANIATNPVRDLQLMDPVVRGGYEAGLNTSATQYINAMTQMHNISREVIAALAPFDALLTPTLTQPAVPIGTMPSKPERYLEECLAWLAFTFPFNCTGQPAISVPGGFSKAGLPIGLQIVGRQNDEAGIIALAAAWEEARPWKDQHPPVD